MNPDHLYEMYRNAMMKLMKDLPEEKIDKYARFMADKALKLKHGENVIHLNYFSDVFSSNDLIEIEEELNAEGIELSSYDQFGVPQNSIIEIVNQIYLSIPKEFYLGVVTGVVANGVWDLVKRVALKISLKVKGTTTEFRTKNKIIIHPINFGISLTIDETTKYEFKLDYEMEADLFYEAMDKILPFSLRMSDTVKGLQYARFDKNKKEWYFINPIEEAQKESIGGQ